MEGKILMKKGLVLLSVATASIFATSLYFKETDKTNSELIRNVPITQGTILSYYDIIKDAKKAVVNISTQKTVKMGQRQTNPLLNDPFFREFFGGLGMEQFAPKDRIERSLGSGVIISENGYIITNNHVIEGADKIIVTLSGDNKEYDAKLIGSDKQSDLAVIKIELKNAPSILFADSSKVKEGDVVFALGNPFGVGETVTHGIVSALNKHGIGINEYENFIQTDAPINPGNSGGALLDSRGALIGINTAILSKSGASNGIGFAIPSNQAKKIATALVNNGKVERGYIGVNIQDLDSKLQKIYGISYGAIIVNVAPQSPAAKGGMKNGDVVIAVNGKKIHDSAELKNMIGEGSPQSQMEFTIIRDKKEIKIVAQLEKKGGELTNKEQSLLIKGVQLATLDTTLLKKFNIPEAIQGVVVTSVKEDNEQSIFAVGDVIYQIEQTPINNLSDLTQALEMYKGDKRIFIYRRGARLITVLP